jgi:hypothetical protein
VRNLIEQNLETVQAAVKAVCAGGCARSARSSCGCRRVRGDVHSYALVWPCTAIDCLPVPCAGGTCTLRSATRRERLEELIVPHSPRPTLFDHLRELGRELARALRTAAKRPTFSLVAIATLGIGIGASTATFSIADAVLMRPLPVHEQRRLSVLWGVDQAAGAAQVPVPYPAFKGFVDGSPRTLSAIAGVDYHGAETLPVREGADGVNLKVALVTGNLFSVLGVTPLLGHNLQAQDDSIAAAPVVAISYELWQRRYGRDPSVLGRVLTIRGQPGTIVAVMGRTATRRSREVGKPVREK